MNVYENIVILDASLSDEQIEESTQKIKDLVAAQGGEVLKANPWGRKKMGYEINKHSRGFYVLFLFKSPAEFIKRLESYYKVTDTVIKYLVIRLEKKQKEAALKSLVAEAAAAEAAAAEAAAAETAAAETAAAETAAAETAAAETAAAETPPEGKEE